MKCNIKINNENKIYYFNSNITIKELKKQILEDISNQKNNVESTDQNKNVTTESTFSENLPKQKIYLYYQEKEIKDDDKQIGELNVFLNELNFSIIIISMNESSFEQEEKGKEKLIKKISSKCSLHKGDRELFICTNCGIAFCSQCSENHKKHKIIEKKDLVKFNENLKSIDQELSAGLSDLNLLDIYENNNNVICNEEKKQCNSSLEKLQNKVDNIKNIYNSLLTNFRNDIDNILPYLLEYKEKVEKLNNSCFQLDTIKNENQFMDFYYWYTNISKKNPQIKEEIKKIQILKLNFKESLETFNNFLENILSYIDKDYKSIQDTYHKKKINTNENSSPSLTSKPKLNLKTLLNQNNNIKKNNNGVIKNLNGLFNNNVNNKTSITKQENTNLSEINKDTKNKMVNFEKISEKTFENEDSILMRYIYSTELKSQNIFCFDILTKTINKIPINFNDLCINKFENFHGTLNYNDSFYLSGGCNSPKIFYKFNYKDRNFEKLPEMINTHSYHGMLGMDNYIYVISGFKTKKVEKYDIIKKNWISLSDLNMSLSWPSCLDLQNKYIYVFGGLSNSLEEHENDKKFLQRLNIENIENKWENLFYIYKDNNIIQLPFYFGLVNLDDKKVLFLGGKFDSKTNNINTCYKFEFEGNIIEKDENYQLPHNEEFNGKVFTNFGKQIFGEFSALSPGNVYLINSLNRSIETFSFEE